LETFPIVSAKYSPIHRRGQTVEDGVCGVTPHAWASQRNTFVVDQALERRCRGALLIDIESGDVGVDGRRESA